MATNRVYVLVHLPGEREPVPAGVLSIDTIEGVREFRYGRMYLDRPDAVPLDPVSLPLQERTVRRDTRKPMFGGIRDSMPDSWGRAVLAYQKGVRAKALSEVELLVGGGESRVGNLSFRAGLDDLEAHENVLPEVTDLDRLMAMADAVEADQRTSDRHTLHLLGKGTSMGGARPKCTVVDDDAMWIAKFPSRMDGEKNVERTEYATMTLAEAAGLDVAGIRLVQVADRDVLLVRRFDREFDGKGFTKRGYLSAKSLMKDQGEYGYADLAGRMRALPGVRPEDLVELYRRMVFNVACRNEDDHGRNHGMIRDESGAMHLSPAFDVVPSATVRDNRVRLSLEIGKWGTAGSLDNLLSRAGEFGLTEEQAMGEIDAVMEATEDWETHFRNCGLDDRDIETYRNNFENTVRQEWRDLQRQGMALSG